MAQQNHIGTTATTVSTGGNMTIPSAKAYALGRMLAENRAMVVYADEKGRGGKAYVRPATDPAPPFTKIVETYDPERTVYLEE